MRFFSCCCVEKDDPLAEMLLTRCTKSSVDQDSVTTSGDIVSPSCITRSAFHLPEEDFRSSLEAVQSMPVREHSTCASKGFRAKSDVVELKRLHEEETLGTLRFIPSGKEMMLSPLTGVHHKGSLALPQAERSVTVNSVTSMSTYAPILMAQIRERLYLGNIDDALNEEELKANGITHILSVTQAKSSVAFVKHEHIVMHDKGHTEIGKVLETAIPFIEEGQENGNTILVHCKAGQNRSATVLIAYLMKKHGKNLYEAHKEVKTKRPLVQINRGYAEQLLKLEKEIYGKNSLPEDWMVQEPVNMKTYEVKFRWASMTSTAHRQFEEDGKL